MYGLAGLLLGSCSPNQTARKEPVQTTRQAYQQEHKCIDTPPELGGIYKGMAYSVDVGNTDSTIVEIYNKESYVKAYVNKDRSKDRLLKSKNLGYDAGEIRKLAHWSGLEKE